MPESVFHSPWNSLLIYFSIPSYFTQFPSTTLNEWLTIIQHEYRYTVVKMIMLDISVVVWSSPTPPQDIFLLILEFTWTHARKKKIIRLWMACGILQNMYGVVQKGEMIRTWINWYYEKVIIYHTFLPLRWHSWWYLTHLTVSKELMASPGWVAERNRIHLIKYI